MRMIILRTMAAVFALTVSATVALAHGGAIEVNSGTRGPVKLSAAQQNAIAVKTVKAAPHPLADLLKISGEVRIPSDRQADISPRLSGQVQELYASLGDEVHTGQKLALIQGRMVGNAAVTITAPMNGVIDERNVIIGQNIEPDTRLFHISDRSRMNVVGKVYEESLEQIKTGQDAHIRLLAYPGQAFTGKVTLVEPNLDAASRTVKAWVSLDNPQGLLKPNMFARVGIVLKSNDSALAIPNDAIIEANGEKFVFVREGDTFNRTEIVTGAQDDEYSEVTEGLVPDDEVVTQGSREIYTMWLTGGKMKSEDGDE